MSSGAGHIQDMINRMRQNNAQRSNRSDAHEIHSIKSTSKPLKFNSATEDEKQILLKKFKLKNRTIRLFEKIFLGITFIILVGIILWLFN